MDPTILHQNPAYLLPELVEEILGHLKADGGALLRCSLVSRVWRRCAAPRLFRTLKTSRFVGARSYRYRRLPAFLRETPTIAGFVRNLVLLAPWRTEHGMRIRVLTEILVELPYIQTLEIRQNNWIQMSSLSEVDRPRGMRAIELDCLKYSTANTVPDKHTAHWQQPMTLQITALLYHFS